MKVYVGVGTRAAAPTITMKHTFFASLALTSVLSLAAFGCASNHDDGAASDAEEVHTAAKSIAATTRSVSRASAACGR